MEEFFPHEDCTVPLKDVFVFDLFLDDVKLRRICPSAISLSSAVVRGYAIGSSTHGFCAVHAPHKSMPGVIWGIAQTDLDDLDHEMRTVRNAARVTRAAITKSGSSFEVDLYIEHNPTSAAMPVTDLLLLLALARQWRFPDAYLEELSRLRISGIGSYEPSKGRNDLK